MVLWGNTFRYYCKYCFLLRLWLLFVCIMDGDFATSWLILYLWLQNKNWILCFVFLSYNSQKLCSLCICCDFVDMYSDGMHLYIYIYISTYICAINTFTLVLYLNTVEIIFTSFSTNWQQHRLLISVSKDLIHNHGNVFYNLWRCFITSLTASLTYWADYVLHQRTATLNQFILSAITLKKMIRNDHTDKWLT